MVLKHAEAGLLQVSRGYLPCPHVQGSLFHFRWAPELQRRNVARKVVEHQRGRLQGNAGESFTLIPAARRRECQWLKYQSRQDYRVCCLKCGSSGAGIHVRISPRLWASRCQWWNKSVDYIRRFVAGATIAHAPHGWYQFGVSIRGRCPLIYLGKDESANLSGQRRGKGLQTQSAPGVVNDEGGRGRWNAYRID